MATRMDSWAAAFVFQMALMGAELPALGHSRIGRQDTCVDAHVSRQGSQLGMLDAITGSIATKTYITFYKSFA